MAYQASLSTGTNAWASEKARRPDHLPFRTERFVCETGPLARRTIGPRWAGAGIYSFRSLVGFSRLAQMRVYTNAHRQQ